LQAARLAVETDRVDVQLDLTPGIDVADAVVAGIDRDRDGALSQDERRTYAARVFDAVELRLDGRQLHVEPVESTFPELDAIKRGEGTIRLRTTATVPRLSRGDHRLFFRNTHQADKSVYLANALVPDAMSVAVTGQRRDPAQRELTIDFAVRTGSAATPAWLFAGLAGAALAGWLSARAPKAA
jgi:hypothetical protein